jgi:hypothetical protein
MSQSGSWIPPSACGTWGLSIVEMRVVVLKISGKISSLAQKQVVPVDRHGVFKHRLHSLSCAAVFHLGQFVFLLDLLGGTV